MPWSVASTPSLATSSCARASHPVRAAAPATAMFAQNGPRTIVVSSDDGYDGAPDNTIFLFAPTGLVFYRR
ncbi:hypothetical protein P4233_20275 [Pseudomonas aeruginosa]|nr:hypothetical protein [Pseudomonas aeruginosa]